jgi:hypothetical protein
MRWEMIAPRTVIAEYFSACMHAIKAWENVKKKVKKNVKVCYSFKIMANTMENNTPKFTVLQAGKFNKKKAAFYVCGVCNGKSS